MALTEKGNVALEIILQHFDDSTPFTLRKLNQVAPVKVAAATLQPLVRQGYLIKSELDNKENVYTLSPIAADVQEVRDFLYELEFDAEVLFAYLSNKSLTPDILEATAKEIDMPNLVGALKQLLAIGWVSKTYRAGQHYYEHSKLGKEALQCRPVFFKDKVRQYKFTNPMLARCINDNLSYSEAVQILLQKYGAVSGDYAILSNGTYVKNTTITRGAEGLEIHHICENEMADLSHPSLWHFTDFQKASELVYADYVEHAILHYLITKEAREKNPMSGLGYGGLFNHNMYQRTVYLLSPMDYRYFGYAIASIDVDLYIRVFSVLATRKQAWQRDNRWQQEIDGRETVINNFPVGITPITLQQYAELRHTSKVKLLMGASCVYVLRSPNDIVMYIMERNNSLFVLNGGKCKRLHHNDPKWYFQRLDQYFSILAQFTESYSDWRKPIVDLVRSLGGDGHMHGNIIDISPFEHIMIDIDNQRIIPYSAMNTGRRIVYPTLFELCAQSYLQPSAEQTALITKIGTDLMFTQDIVGLTIPIVEQPQNNCDKGFYSFNTKISRIEKTINCGVVYTWEDKYESDIEWNHMLKSTEPALLN